MMYFKADIGVDFMGLVRFPGPGLGNLLFPISRALINAQRHGGCFIYPTWRQVKIGPFLRGEPDKRIYHFGFRRRTFFEWSLFFNAYFSRHYSESCLCSHGTPIADACYVSKGHGRYFYDLPGSKDLLKNWLVSICSSSGDALRNGNLRPPRLTVHVRLGDFVTASDSKLDLCYRIDKSWYISRINMICEQFGISKSDVVIVSDAATLSIKNFLGIDGFTYIGGDVSTPLDCLLFAQQTEYFIGSCSSYSLWIAYLSEAKCFWNKGFAIEKYFPLRLGIDFAV